MPRRHRILPLFLAFLPLSLTAQEPEQVPALLARGDSLATRASDQPRQAHPWHELGLVNLALTHAGAPYRPTRFNREGLDYPQSAIVAFARAIELDPTFTAATVGLVEAVELSPRWGATGIARDALRRVDSAAPSILPRVLLVHALLEREGGHRVAVAPLLQRFLAAGGDSGIGLLELARERFNEGHPEAGIALYWRAVSAARSPEARRLLSKGLALIAAPGEMAEFDALEPESRAEWVRRFWTRRDVASGLPDGARLTEHFRRYEVARREYRPVHLGLMNDSVSAARRMLDPLPQGLPAGDTPSLPNPNQTDGVGSQTSLTPEGSLLLSRESAVSELRLPGLLYMRHGPPDDRAGSFWLYHLSDGDLMLRSGEHHLGTACDLDSRYCRYELSGARVPPETRRRWEAGLDGAQEWALTNDGMIRRFPKPMTPAVVAYGLPDSGTGRGRLLVGFALPAGHLKPQSLDSGVAYAVRLELTAAPERGEFRIGHDTLRTFLTRGPLPGREQLLGLETLEAPPGTYRFRIAFTTPDGSRGALLGAESLTVAPADANRLEMSDLILGTDSSRLLWRHGSFSIPVDPFSRFRRREPLSVYYQAVGLEPGTAYTTALEVLRSTEPAAKPLVSLRVEGVSEGAVLHVQRSLGLQRLRPGVYTLRVTLTRATDTESVRREVRLKLVE
ncbi:MAG: hypothetical protein SF070_07140 [Gemmatimonadota bacterium]|nr:hypothetical protein [Gemmatimonadota bacterium]